jgi:hypothetical protein
VISLLVDLLRVQGRVLIFKPDESRAVSKHVDHLEAAVLQALDEGAYRGCEPRDQLSNQDCNTFVLLEHLAGDVEGQVLVAAK